jgi:branched-chain amino acid transport system permease protein
VPLVIQFLVLGLSAGAVYVALGLSVTTIYMATGTVNFAQGAMSMVGAYVTATLISSGQLVLPVGSVHIGHVSTAVAIILGVVSTAALAVLSHFLVFRSLRKAPPLAQVVASIGLMIFVQALVILRFGSSAISMHALLTADTISVGSSVVNVGDLILGGLAIVVSVVAWAYFRYTRVGIATRAGAEAELSVRLMGYSPERLAYVVWAGSGAVSGLFVILAAPNLGLDSDIYTLYIVPALAVALLARFSRVLVCCVAGLGLGMVLSLLTLANTKSWWPNWAKYGTGDILLVVIVMLAVFGLGAKIPSRGSFGQMRLPAVTIPTLRPRNVATVVMLGLLAILLSSGGYRYAIITSIALIPLTLSYVVITGFLGQISLAQIAFAGTAAFVLSKLDSVASLPFPISLLISAFAAAGIGVIVAAPALRIRGVHLAVVTLAAAVGVQQFILGNPAITPVSGENIGAPKLFGLSLAVRQGHDVARVSFGIATLVVVTLVVLLVARLLQGGPGRAFLAVRSNERAAASAGVNVTWAKIIGFAISGFLAGTTGGLIGYSQSQVSADEFAVVVGITILAVTYLGGITSLSGAIVGGALASGGVVYLFWNQTINLGNYYQLATGGGLIVTAILNPSGIVTALRSQVQWVMRRLRKLDASSKADVPGLAAEGGLPSAGHSEVTNVG